MRQHGAKRHDLAFSTRKRKRIGNRKAEVKVTLEDLDKWLRHKLRAVLWRQWKRASTRTRQLIATGTAPEMARASAGNGNGPWWNACSSHMNQAVPHA